MVFKLFAILQKYEFSSKSQHPERGKLCMKSCLRYCKSTSFQANHNLFKMVKFSPLVVCDTAKVRVFKQITTSEIRNKDTNKLFAILQKYEFSSKSQLSSSSSSSLTGCLRYCKSTSFQANHNAHFVTYQPHRVVCDTAKVRVFKQITTCTCSIIPILRCLRYCKSTSFQANHNSRASGLTP